MKTDFLKQEKERLTSRLVDNILLSNEQAPLKKILEGKYPIIFKELAKREAYKLLEQENPIELKKNKRFDFDGEKFKNQFSELKKSILLELFFSAKEIKAFAKFSVAFQLDIIVKPRQASLNILFKKNDEIDKAAAMDIIAGFGEDRPFVRKLIAALENEKPSKLRMDEVARLSEKIETNVYKLTPISSFLTDVGLYIDYEISITGDYQTLFPSEILCEMLVKRGLDSIAKKIKAEETRDFWTISEIENTFERFLLVGNLEQLETKLSKERPEKKQPVLSEKKQKKEEAEKQQINFLDDFAKKNDEPSMPKNENTTNGQAKVKEPQEQKKTIKEENVTPLNGNDGQRPQILTLINPDDKDFLVSSIFDNKMDEFSQFIEKLDEINKWQTARAAINEEIVKRNISPYSKEAILLGDVVFSKYFTAK